MRRAGSTRCSLAPGRKAEEPGNHVPSWKEALRTLLPRNPEQRLAGLQEQSRVRAVSWQRIKYPGHIEETCEDSNGEQFESEKPVLEARKFKIKVLASSVSAEDLISLLSRWHLVALPSRE
uniref:cDNA FLJ42418 fis, clone BLADE2001987 n=1 Tax=Homo sapiens TaxID=9606 RepID=Q6ZVL4_HUMAN|nr:unnamed protein product [Homo sapiens]